MSAPTHLTRAPITEAVIDFRVETRESATLESIDQALKGESFGYYIKNPIYRTALSFSINLESASASEVNQLVPQSRVGLRLHSQDEKYVAMFTLEGFSLSRLPPYENWGLLSAEAKRLWNVYAEFARPALITRIATRFINNLRLPLQAGESYDKYLKLLPNFPAEVPKLLQHFLQQYLLRDPESEDNVLVTHVWDGKPIDGLLPIILDIDAYRVGSFSPDSAQVWDCLERLRKRKNDVFFGLLTKPAMDLYR